MSEKRFDVVGIGNAIVDVLARVTEDFLVENKVEKGIMTLIDAERAISLYGAMGPAQEISGGSVANTIAGLGMLGAKSAFVGKVKDDQLGAIFAHDIRSLGVAFDTPMTGRDRLDEETGRCIVLVSPDGERSMNTYLGACIEFQPDDIREDEVAASKVIYLEGYLFDAPAGPEIFAHAAALTEYAVFSMG